VASAHPFPNRELHCSSMPKSDRYLVSLLAMMDDMHFAAISPNAISRHLFGSAKSPFFGKILSLICCQSTGLN
jgi:hypothetical protein